MFEEYWFINIQYNNKRLINPFKKALVMTKTTSSKDFLGKLVTVKMDRPLGTKHPKYGYEYPVNYGFIPNTVSCDGEELDAYVIGPTIPLHTFTGRVIAIIHRIDDDDNKLVVVPDDQNPTNDEIEEKTNFQEQWFKHIIIRS